MNRNTTRGLALGLLIAAAALFFYERWEEKTPLPAASAPDMVSKADYEKAVGEAKTLREQLDALTAERDALLAKTPEEETKKADKPKTYHLLVREGTNSKEISRLLEEQGIVENAEEFDQYLADRNLQGYIQIGEYTIKKGMSYKEIASMIAKSR